VSHGLPRDPHPRDYSEAFAAQVNVAPSKDAGTDPAGVRPNNRFWDSPRSGDSPCKAVT